MSKKYRKIFFILGLIVIVIITTYAIASFAIALYITGPTAKHIDVSPVFVNKNYQSVSFKTSDNLTLRGWLFDPSSEKFVIFVPGFLDNRTNGGYYGIDLTRDLIAQNFGVLLYDPRTRGESEGKTRLKDESLDVVAAVNYLKTKNVKPENIYIISFSTGSRATLLALPEIQGIGGIIVDSTPTNFKSVLNYVVTVEQKIPGIIIPGIYFWLENKGINLGSEEILQNVKESKVPLLVLHAKNDQSVPIENSEEIINANKNAELVIFPSGSHIETYKFNPDKYREVLFNFFQ